MRTTNPVAPWSLVEEETLSEHNIFTLQRSVARSPVTGRNHKFLRLHAPDWVNVIALDTDGRLVLVEQYRHGTRETTVEIPGGAVDAGESPETAAARELEEETGFAPARMTMIGVVDPNPAFLSNRCWTFLAAGCVLKHRLETDPSEEISVRLEPVERFTELIDDGSIKHALVVAAHDHLQRGRAEGAPWATGLPL